MNFREIFSEILGPTSETIPFNDRSWLGIAFDRNAYDNCRMPERFFRYASQHFAESNDPEILIAGECFKCGGLPEIAALPFTWESYREFMLCPSHYCTEYRMAGANSKFACLADADVTVFGGASGPMEKVYSSMGGKAEVLGGMRQEFFLGDSQSYPEFDRYLRRLVGPRF